MKLYIKNMVSLRCKLVVKDKLNKLNIPFRSVELGEIEILAPISDVQKVLLKIDLLNAGLELIDDSRAILIERIKIIIVELVHYRNEFLKINFSDYLSEKLGYSYSYLANIFSEVKGTTLEHFIITHKIERVKELLVYDELSLKEISNKLYYGNVSYLCNQFKKITGLTPSHFKKLKHTPRFMLEEL